MAYYGSLGDIDVGAISSTKSETAVDVFVYDTRKDSDGGAWRKRTQHTSWYNETLNTATRGSRRNFPAVAVIVIDGTFPNKVTIYDGDDPDLPIWMVFETGRTPTLRALNWWTSGNGLSGVNSVVALNGLLVISPGNGTVHFDFIKDSTRVSYGPTGSDKYQIFPGTILTRNNYITSISNGDGYVLVNSTVNDIAMTVLPNAPIDPSTGLPVPTVAVATNGGVSVIRDDGTVVDITGQTEPPYRITFNKSNPNEIITSGYWTRVMKIYNIPSSDVGESTQLRYYVDSETPKLPFGGGALNFESSQTQELFVSVSGGTPANGFYKIAENLQSKLNGMTAYIRTDCNTGWMHGDIKGAFLSDTSTASVTGTELITNGTFDSNITGWTASTSTNTWSSGAMQITRSGGTGQATYQAFTTVSGQRYVATASVNSSGSRGDLFIINGTGWGGTQIGAVNGTNGQTRQLTLYFTATSTTTTLAFAVDNNATSITVDNVSVRTEEPDRSVNNTGLAVYGTITKTPVETGANLVAYGGFDSPNYLYQPHSSTLSFGTNDFCVSYWYKNISGDEINIQKNTRGADGWRIVPGNAASDVYIVNGNFTAYGVLPGISNRNVWNHWVIIRRYNIGWFIYKNGAYAGIITALSGSNFNEVSPFTVGSNTVTSNLMSLLRISQSVPSPDQILKIYNDEKTLFQPGAQATLYGASDAVTALAYDNTTDLLSVGTSSGRSDFSGLKRINNTTTAVTTAISASNGLIAEQ